jgi:hypothetical protein
MKIIFDIIKKKEMNTTPGIIFEKDKKTGKRYVRDLNDDFDKAWASAISGKQLREHLCQNIDTWEWEEKNRK